MQRERLGAWGDRAGLERGLSDWLGSLVDMDDPEPALQARRPLRAAAGTAGWCRVDLKATPHQAWLGVRCTLALMTRLERAR